MKSSVDNDFIIQQFSQYSRMVLRIAFHNTSNMTEAEDITQEVFLKLMKEKNGFVDEEHCKAWLIRVTINRCKDYLKCSRHNHNVPFIEENLGTEHFNADLFDAGDKQVFVEISKLPINLKNVIYLHYIMGYTITEISNLLDKNENTVSSWLRRAKKKLRFSMEGDEMNESRKLYNGNE